jgi:hypothetical protein
VQSNSLGTEQVLSSGKAGRNGNDLLAAVVVENIIAPLLRGSIDETGLEDLDPGGGAVGAESIADFADVHGDGTLVVSADGFVAAAAVVVLLVHLDGHGAAGVDAAELSGLPGVGIAADILRGC